MDFTNKMPVSGKSIGIAIKWIILITFFGVIVNLALLIAQWDTIVLLRTVESGVMGNLWRSILCLVVVFLFPILFFVLGQRYGVEKAVYFLICKHKKALVVYLLQVLHGEHPEFFELKEQATDKVIAIINNVSNYIGKIPLLGSILNGIVSKIDLGTKFVLAVKSTQSDELSKEQQLDKIADMIADKVPLDIFEPDAQLLLILTAINIGVFFL